VVRVGERNASAGQPPGAVEPFGIFGQFGGAVCVPLPPDAAGAEATGAGLAALAIATPPMAIMPTERRVVAMSRRAADMWCFATGVSASVAVVWRSAVSIEVSLPLLN
jgi:hypothetical protein